MRFRLLFLSLFSSFLFIGASRCAVGVKPDSVTAALVSGDYTALIEGCGNQLVPGYTYCRFSEGEIAQGFVTFVAPPVICLGKKEEPCVTFKVYFPTGEPTYGGEIPRGKTRANVEWETLLHKKTFEKGDRGFWPFTYRIRWVDPEGKEQLTMSQGEIRLRVYSKEYIPLQNVSEDENYVWKWVENGLPVHMTTGARTYVGLKP